jgi:hypothetical protein
MAMRRIFGPKREAGTGGWREEDSELYNLFFLQSI